MAYIMVLLTQYSTSVRKWLSSFYI